MKSLRTKIKNSVSPILYEDYSGPTHDLRSSSNSKYRLNTKMAEHSAEEDTVLSDLERENQQNLQEAKKLIQKTKRIIQTSGNKNPGKAQTAKNRSFDGGVLKTSISNRAAAQSERFAKVNASMVSLEDMHRAGEEFQSHTRVSNQSCNN